MTEFLLSPGQRDLAAALSAYLGRHYELRQALDAGAAPAWGAIADELDLPAALVPAGHGGLGLGPVEAMVIARELGRVLYRGPWLATCALAGPALAASTQAGAEAGTGAGTQARLLAGIASGETTACLADDTLLAPSGRPGRVTASPQQTLDGQARLVLDGATADRLLVLADDEHGGSLYLVTDRGGVAIEPLETLDLTRPVAALDFRSAPAERVGEPGAAPRIREAVRLLAGLASAAESLGGTERCLDTAASYARTRFQFGRPIGSFQAVKHKLADLLVQVEFTRTAVWHAAWSAGTAAPDAALAVHVAQAQAGDAYLRVAADNIQVHGGIGFTWDHDAHLYFRRAKSMQLMFGSPDAHRERVAALVGI